MTSICILNGHPDPRPERLNHALCDAYQAGAEGAGHAVERIEIGALDYGFLGSKDAFDTPPDEPLRTVREALRRADHVFLSFPLWLGGMPSKTRAFFEHAARGGYFLEVADSAVEWPKKMLKGKSARLVVTMGMPGAIYKLLFGAHTLKGFEQGVLGISGVKPIRHTVIGGVDAASDKARAGWFDDLRKLGAEAR